MPYFTSADLRALPDLDSTQRFPDARLVAAHDWIVGIVERVCETSFVVVGKSERLTGDRTDVLRLSDPYVRVVTAVTVDGVALTPGELAGLFLDAGYLYQPSGYVWPATTRGNITVAYDSGYSAEPPADLREAMLRGARHWLLTMDGWSGTDERALSISNDYGNITLSAPGDGRPTGLPTVDATIMAWARKVRVPKVA